MSLLRTHYALDIQLPQILLVEQNLNELNLLIDLLKNTSWSSSIVHAATTAQEGLEEFDRLNPHLVIVNLNLPDMSALDFLLKLKTQSHAYPAIIVLASGKVKESVIVDAITSGASDYLVKETLNADVLNRALNNAKERSDLKRKLRRNHEEQQQFASCAAHDLQSPLNTIWDMLNCLRCNQNIFLDPKSLEYVDHIIEAAGNMSSLIQALLNFAKTGREPNQFDPVDLTKIINQAILFLTPFIQEKKAQIHFDALPTIHGDQTGLLLLFQNLINNGLKFNISDTPRMEIAVDQNDKYYKILIKDNGIGIKEQEREKIFQPLYRSHMQADFDGSGLGLAICQRIVNQHKGRIWVTDNIPQGTIFNIILPKVRTS